MKILHTSDWHLGRMIYGRSLLEDQAYFIDQVFFSALERHRPDCVILAGDIFDRQIAPVEAIRLFDSVLSRIHQMGIPLAAISGNHDGADRIAIGAEMLRQSGIYLATHLEDLTRPLRLEKDGERVDLHLLPYCDPATIRQFLGRDDLQGFQASYQALLDTVRPTLNPSAFQILVAHCFVAGSQTCDSESAIYVGGSGEVNLSAFTGFDYVALGHLHGPQRAGEHGRYSGSPLKYSFDEESHKKSMTLLTIENGSLSLELLPIAPLRDVRTISGTLEELLELGGKSPQNDYLFVRITNQTPVYMPAEQLRPYYPNLLAVHCDWLQRNLEEEAREENLREQLIGRKIDQRMVLEQFLRQICGTEPSPEEEALFLEVFQRVQSESEMEEGGQAR